MISTLVIFTLLDMLLSFLRRFDIVWPNLYVFSASLVVHVLLFIWLDIVSRNPEPEADGRKA